MKLPWIGFVMQVSVEVCVCVVVKENQKTMDFDNSES